MIIAINANQYLPSSSNDFYVKYLVGVAASHPEHQFIFITTAKAEEPLNRSNNILHLISAPITNNRWMRKFWLDYTLPGIVQKHKPSIVINTGVECSMRTSVPQWVFLSDLSFLHSPLHFSKKQRSFLKNKLPGFLKKADGIVTSSDIIAKEIKQQYSIKEDKIKTFPLTVEESYQPIYWGEKETVKKSYVDGKEYFLFSGEIHPQFDLVNLLKAYSFFKTRQQSNMQLVITASSLQSNNPFNKIFNTYKYRRDVRLLIDLPENELAKITAAAYAFIYPAYYAETALFPLRAIQCEVPVISSQLDVLKENLGDAAFYVDPSNFEDIAEKMMLLFKDESKRAELITCGKLIRNATRNEKLNSKWWKFILAYAKKGRK